MTLISGSEVPGAAWHPADSLWIPWARSVVFKHSMTHFTLQSRTYTHLITCIFYETLFIPLLCRMTSYSTSFSFIPSWDPLNQYHDTLIGCDLKYKNNQAGLIPSNKYLFLPTLVQVRFVTCNLRKCWIHPLHALCSLFQPCPPHTWPGCLEEHNLQPHWCIHL